MHPVRELGAWVAALPDLPAAGRDEGAGLNRSARPTPHPARADQASQATASLEGAAGLGAHRRWTLSLQPGSGRSGHCCHHGVHAGAGISSITVLSGPEGGLAPEELAAAARAGFVPVTLGPRVLRAETAPLAVLSAVALLG